jgi:hypothetical protein
VSFVLPLLKVLKVNAKRRDKTDARCASLLSFTVVLLMSLPMDNAMCENSPFPGGFALLCRSRCFASELRVSKALLLRIESTHALNSFVRSCVDVIE